MDQRNPSHAAPVAMYGGSFDPVHRGHLAVAQRAQQAFGLSRVWFVPAARPPHKPGQELASGRDRVAMLELATCDLTWAEVEPLELSRTGPSYTFDTVATFLARDPSLAGRLHLILGGDNLPGLPGWHRVLELLERVQPIVLRRQGDPNDPLEPLASRLPAWATQKLSRGFLDLPPVSGRASSLRSQLAAGERDLPDLPPGVLHYILRRGLYGTGSSARDAGSVTP